MDGFLSLFRQFNFPTLFFGLFMLAVMAGCVQVETIILPCGDGKGSNGIVDPGACNPVSYTGSANGFWDTTSSPPYTQYQGGGNCAAGSKKCGIPAGRCNNGQPCKSWVTPGSMMCKCDCNP